VQRLLLVLLVAASYALLAGGRSWTLMPLLGLALLAVASAPSATLRFPREHRGLDLALIALLLTIGLQLVPLPASLHQTLSPNAMTLRQAAEFGALSPARTSVPLSIRPQATIEALMICGLGILAFWTARGVFAQGGSTRSVCRMLGVIGAIAAIAALAQKGIAPKLLIFGVQPEARSTNPFGAFTNRNHFAAWLLLITVTSVGYLIAELQTHRFETRHLRHKIKELLSTAAVMTGVSAAITLFVMLMTFSRSALAASAAAGATLWQCSRARLDGSASRMPVTLALLGALVVGGAILLGAEGWLARLGDTLGPETAISRPTIWRETLPMVRDFWLTGTGAGTYSDAMLVYQQTRVWVASMQHWTHFNNAHSHFLQVAAEGGILIIVPVVAAVWSLARLVTRAIKAERGEVFWIRVGAAAGLVGLAVQSVWEVALVMPANAVMAGVLAGLAVYQRSSHGGRALVRH